ncbi:MAG: hypothetical protein IJG52_00515 [Lachnospiraceae bacterium]|nr:hypothetical protein [Lachnospiraceae bacterium]
MKRIHSIRGIAVLLLCLALLTPVSGCGRRVILTTGFGHNELMRIGNTSCSAAEYRVYLLDMQKRCELLFGTGIWETPIGESLDEMIREKALSQSSRVKVVLLLAIQDNIMLTTAEESRAEEAAAYYLSHITEEESGYLRITEEELAKMFEEYQLAHKVYKSAGTGFEERFDSYTSTIDYDLNRKLFGSIGLLREGSVTGTPAFSQVFKQFFEVTSENDSAGDR